MTLKQAKTLLTPFLCVSISAILFNVTADVTSLSPRLFFQDNSQSVYSASLSMQKRRCETLRVGLLVRYT